MTAQIARYTTSAAILGLLLGLASPAHAGGVILQTPKGLKPGDQFRIVIVTDGFTSAQSSDITTYDSFVSSDIANAGGVTFNGRPVTGWLAIGSTQTVNAIDHIGKTGTPVYLVDGTEVAANTKSSGLWSGSIMNPIHETIEAIPYFSDVWTGTNSGGDRSRPLGDARSSTTGSASFIGASWIDDGSNQPSAEFPLFGISGVLTVPQSVPEPSSMLLILTGMVAFPAYVQTRRLRGKRRPEPGVSPSSSLR
jgi:hypothetical protein